MAARIESGHIMLRSLLQFPNRSRFFRQYIATLLLLFFAWDMVLDSVPPAHAIRDSSRGSVVSISSGGADNPSDDHPDCGLPDHGCALTHHHHFPGVLSSAGFTILVAALHLATSDEVPATGHSSSSNLLIRAPPCI
jgi:hypothetical protein